MAKQTYENHLDENKARWFAVYTKYKREKIVESRLKEKQIHVYLPLLKVVRKWEKSRKIRTVELPLLSCYIFVKIIKKDYVRVLETEHVIKFVRFSKNLISIPEQEINTLKRVIGEEVEVTADQEFYTAGDEVEIIRGNLTGLKGKLLAVEGKNQMIVELKTIGFALRMNIDIQLLKKIK